MEYPEHERMKEVQSEAVTIGEFLEWLQSKKGYGLCENVKERWYPVEVNYSIEKLLAEYFQIDLNKIEAEKREMLASIRQSNETK